MENPRQESGAVQTEQYDFIPDLPPASPDDPELAGKDCVEAEYSFTGDDIREGLKAFQKAAIYKKYMIYTGILIVVFVIYLINFTQGEQFLPGVLAVLSLAVIGMLWYFPRQHIKRTAEATDANPGMIFRMTVYEDCVRISDQASSFLLHYVKEITRTLETENLFLICVGKERIFLLPKRYLEPEQQEKIRGMLTAAMGDKHTKSI
ncbi:MAG: YcxB family protein [Oscillospiraceae bacterium]|jgi:hypothetical protein|nr:YcxB family protein [Oscillospiraceae bacterium]